MTTPMLIALLWLVAGAVLIAVAAAILAGAWGLLATGIVFVAAGLIAPWEKLGGRAP